MKNNKLNDKELRNRKIISDLIIEGDSNSLSKAYSMIEKLIYKMAHKYKNVDDIEELIGVGHLSFMSASKNYTSQDDDFIPLFMKIYINDILMLDRMKKADKRTADFINSTINNNESSTDVDYILNIAGKSHEDFMIYMDSLVYKDILHKVYNNQINNRNKKIIFKFLKDKDTKARTDMAKELNISYFIVNRTINSYIEECKKEFTRETKSIEKLKKSGQYGINKSIC